MRFKQMKANYVRCSKMITDQKRGLILSLLFALIGVSGSAVSSITLKEVVDTAIPNGDIKYLWILQITFFTCVAMSSLFGVLERRTSYGIAAKAQCKLREQLYSRIINASYLSLQKTKSASIITTMSYAIDGLEGLLCKCISNTLSNILTIVIILIIMFRYDAFLTLLSIGVFPILVFILSKIGNQIEKSSKIIQKKRVSVTRQIEESISCFVNIQDFGLHKYVTEKYAEDVQSLSKYSIHRHTIVEIMNRASWTLVIVPYQAVLFGVGGTLAILNGMPTIGTLLVFSNFTNFLIQPVMSLVQLVNDLAVSISAFDYIDDLMKLEQKEKVTYPCPRDKENYLEIQSLSYAYPGQTSYAIQNIQHCFKEKTTSVLWGKSGCGKSTLLKIISGLISPPDNNCIRKNSTKTWGYFPQEPWLFSISIRDNFRLVNPEISEHRIWDLLQSVGLEDTIKEKAEGINITINGQNNILSMGEFRRLCLAVFLAREKDILLFDEPTASLDSNSADIIVNVIGSMKNKNMIIATHDVKFKTIAQSVIYMEEWGR